MAMNLSSLTAYVDEQKSELIKKSILGAESIKYLNLMSGVVGETALNLLNTSVTLGNGKVCGFSDGTEQTISQRNIVPALVKVNAEWCDKDFADYYMNHEVRMAAGKTNLPFEEEFIADIVANVDRQVEDAIWRGLTISGVSYAGLYQCVSGVTAVTAGSSVYKSVLAVYNAIPAENLFEDEIFCGQDTFRELVLELVAKNLYHYDATVEEGMTLVIPGTRTKIHGVPGLNGQINSKRHIIALNPAHTFYGTDMANDKETFDFWFSKDNDTFRLKIAFSLGVQVAFLDEVARVEW